MRGPPGPAALRGAPKPPGLWAAGRNGRSGRSACGRSVPGGFAARLMRRVLIDHARRLKAGKRSVPGFLPLDSELAWTESLDEVALDLNVAIQELEGLDSSAVRALELRYFLGCTGEETAALLGVSPSTVDRSLRFSLAWLHGRLHRD